MSALTTQIETGDTAESSDESNDSDDETNKIGKNGKKSASTKDGGIYVPPKLSAVHYDGEDTKAERARKQIERARKRALKYVNAYYGRNDALFYDKSVFRNISIVQTYFTCELYDMFFFYFLGVVKISLRIM